MRRLPITLLFAISLVTSAAEVGAQSSRLPDITLTADRVFVPSAEVGLEDGFGGSLDVFQFFGSGPFGITPSLTYSFHGVEEITSLHLLAPSVGLGVRFPLFRSENFLVLATGSFGGGPYVAAIADRLVQPDGTPYANQSGVGVLGRVAAQLGLHFNPIVSIEVGGEYGWYGGLGHTGRVRIGAALAIEEFGVPLDLVASEADELFPSLANSYSNGAPVTVTVQNRSRFPMREVEVLAGSDGVIPSETEAAKIESIEPGGTAQTALRFPLQAEAAQNPSERSVQISLDVRAQVGTRNAGIRPFGVIETRLLERNALTWSDDRKAASFVTPTSDTVLRLSREISSVARDVESTIEPTLLYAMVAAETINALGIEYSVDPNLPSFVNSQQNVEIVDYLQYSEETLRFASGDCDDLSILYASLLQAAGLRSAFITIPGHLYSAVRLSMTPEAAERTFRNDGDFILHDGHVWLPVETTILDQGFVAAWKTGAEQWRRNVATDDATLIPINEAWETYPPAPSQPEEEQRELDLTGLEERMQTELLRFVQVEFAPSITQLERQIEEQGPSVRRLSNLGSLYAQTGVFDEAERYFEAALEIEDHPSPLMNLANIRRLEGDYAAALKLYRRAEELRPSSTSLWLSIALTLREQGRLEESEVYYQRYAERRPSSARAYAYLGSGAEDGQARASLSATGRSILLWETVDDISGQEPQ